MEETERSKDGSTDTKEEHHLCVLVHGLWGSPHHLDYLSTALSAHHGSPTFHILVSARNAGSFTYDGIELGGERVTRELEDSLAAYTTAGTPITRLSVVGYSLGGLVARYAIGLLDSRGWFDDGRLTPMNFTTFATPHLGVRTPGLGYHHTLWNSLGARTLSMSGRQLFTIDSFRATGRPLLSLLADPGSIFLRALAKFRVRSLYANIINDRTAPYYTTSISKTDPYRSLSSLALNYEDGFAPIVLSAPHPISASPAPRASPSRLRALLSATTTILYRVPLVLGLVLFVPIGVMVFLVNSAVQSVRSARRIRLHEQGHVAAGFGDYRVPLMVEEAHSAVEEASAAVGEAFGGKANGHVESASTSDDGTPVFPPLALSDAQLAMIDALDAEPVRFVKHPVHIHNIRHSHAAIIVRSPTASRFREGKEVVRFWVEEEFVV